MQYTDEDLFVYQLMDFLVCEHDYKIVNVPGGKRDVWLANEQNEKFPMIRLTSSLSTSTMFEREYLNKVKGALSLIVHTERPLLMINTNRDSSDFVEEDVIQIKVADRFISDVSLDYVFPGIVGRVHTVTNNQNECARLISHLENFQRKKIKEATKFRWKTAPKMTIVCIAISILIFLGINIISTGAMDTSWLADVVIAGGYYKAMVVYGHEYWRFFTSIFVHYDVFSLLFYCLAMYQIGKEVESQMPKWQFLLIFLGSGIIGNMFVYTMAGNNVSLGMSGGLFGLFAAYLLYIWQNRLYLNPFHRYRLIQLITIAISSFVFSGTDLFALLGGFISGFFMAILVSNNKKYKDIKIHFAICSLLALCCLGYGVVTVNTAYPEVNELNEEIVKEYERLGLAEYAKYVDNYFKDAYEE